MLRKFINFGFIQIRNRRNIYSTITVQNSAILTLQAGVYVFRGGDGLTIEDGASHSEGAWASRLPGALEFLYGG